MLHKLCHGTKILDSGGDHAILQESEPEEYVVTESRDYREVSEWVDPQLPRENKSHRVSGPAGSLPLRSQLEVSNSEDCGPRDLRSHVIIADQSKG